MKQATFTPTPAISSKDARIICDVVELFFPNVTNYSTSSYQELKMHILRIFGTDITPDHFIMLGQVIGLKSVTYKKHREKSNQISYGFGNN